MGDRSGEGDGGEEGDGERQSLKKSVNGGRKATEGFRWILWRRVIQLIKDTPRGANHPLMGGWTAFFLNTFPLCTHALVPERTTPTGREQTLILEFKQCAYGLIIDKI